VGLDRTSVELIEKTVDSIERSIVAVIRDANQADKQALLTHWAPKLRAGPPKWLDRLWNWDELDNPTELACKEKPRWLVLAAEDGELFGTLVISGPIALRELVPGASSEPYLWIEYLAIAPSIRRDCPPGFVRAQRVVPVGVRLMQVVIELSVERGAGGRVALHAEGDIAIDTYKKWEMRRLPERARHPSDGELYWVFVGDEDWAQTFSQAATSGVKEGSR